MFEKISPAVSLLGTAVALSGTAMTVWLNVIRRGTVKMTRPSQISFGAGGEPKVHACASLYATAARGVIVESMFARVEDHESKRDFEIWVHGPETLHRASGLRVGREGVAADHHFLLHGDAAQFSLAPGEYTVSFYAELVGHRGTIPLQSVKLTLTEEVVAEAKELGRGVFFDWSPTAKKYLVRAHRPRAPKDKPFDAFADLLGLTTTAPH
jgi:hypothetical protein